MTLAGLLLATTSNFDATQREVKRTLVPLICRELSQAALPAMVQEMDAGRWGVISCGTGELGMESLMFQPEDTRIELHPDAICVWIERLGGRSQAIDWWYRQSNFPRLRDHGRASVRFSDASIHVAINVDFATPKPTFVVSSAQCTVGALKLRVSGTCASFLYNWLLAALNAHIKSAIEQGLQQLLLSLGTAATGPTVVAPLPFVPATT